MAGLNKGKAIAPGFSVYILVIINCVLMSLTYWVTLKNNKALLLSGERIKTESEKGSSQRNYPRKRFSIKPFGPRFVSKPSKGLI